MPTTTVYTTTIETTTVYPIPLLPTPPSKSSCCLPCHYPLPLKKLHLFYSMEFYFQNISDLFLQYFQNISLPWKKSIFFSDQLKCYPAIEVCKRHGIKSRIQCTLGNFIFPFNNINLLWVSYFLLFCLRVPRLLLFSVVPIIGSFILYLI